MRGYGSEPAEFTGSFQPSLGTEVRVERLAFGPLRIRCQVRTDGGSVGTLFDEADIPLEALGTRAVFIINDISERARAGSNVVIPLNGRLEVGQSLGLIGGADYPILRSGTVSLLGRSLADASLYQAGMVQLDPGDLFLVDDATDAAYGFVVADERPALAAVFRAVGKKGRVSRFGAKGYEVSTSIRSRVVNDGAIQAAWVTFLTLVGLLRFVRARERKS